MSLSLFLSHHQKTKSFSSPLIRHGYAQKLRQVAPVSGKSRTKQSFKDECDINTIMKRYAKTGVLDFVSKHAPQYGDVTGLDFQHAMDTVAAARTMFEDLPAKLRQRFENDPGQFVDFVSDERNREEAQELGLLRPKDESSTPPTTPPAEGAPAPSTPAPRPSKDGTPLEVKGA